ncbi:MAG: alpha/beta hydrolase [Candidatus Lokiarchaeota archaeon]|nr:alpha/beta hydrolase [Candidatus Lokiarchaeota archaeon]
MAKILVKDINMYYEMKGEGFPIVMIMGLAGNADWWDLELIEGLSRNYKTIVFDNRGVARTDNNDTDFTMKDLADDTIGLMDALNIEKAHILGVSMGGVVAQEIAINYPERVQKLILCSTSCGGAHFVAPDMRVLGVLAAGRGDKTQEEFSRSTTFLLYPEEFMKEHPEIVEDRLQIRLQNPIADNTYDRQAKGAFANATGEKLKNIKIPTLVLHGKQDILIPFGNGEKIAELIPGAKLQLFEKSGHALFTIETDAVLNAIVDFLK